MQMTLSMPGHAITQTHTKLQTYIYIYVCMYTNTHTETHAYRLYTYMLASYPVDKLELLLIKASYVVI